MKRGWIHWDKTELPPAALEARLEKARKVLAARDLPALVVYTDVWRSNQARYLTNFMPYWNRSLAVVPREGAPVLLCALSPRVYPWIKSVTVFEEIRPAGKLVPSLTQLCTERGWKRIGVLDLARLPYELHNSLRRELEVVDIPAFDSVDESELAMRRRAAEMARRILEDALPSGRGMVDHQFVGRLERDFRRAGAEDLIILVGRTPAKGVVLGDEYSVSVALEYRGNWVKVTRAHGRNLRDRFEAALRENSGYVENLSGPYPYEGCERSALAPGSVFSLHVDDGGLNYGDTCMGTAPL